MLLRRQESSPAKPLERWRASGPLPPQGNSGLWCWRELDFDELCFALTSLAFG